MIRSKRLSLDEIARRHGTDKSTQRHSFTPIYETFVAHLRDRPVTVLEIGVLRGASLRMWRDYFADGTIYALDIKEEAKQHAEERIHIHIGDQKKPDVLDRILAQSGPLDLIVDDGGHRAEQQLGSLFHLWEHLKPGGVYMIEDIHTSYLARWKMGYRAPWSTVEFLKTLVDDLHSSTHGRPPSLPDLQSVHFQPELCILTKKPWAQ